MNKKIVTIESQSSQSPPKCSALQGMSAENLSYEKVFAHLSDWVCKKCDISFDEEAYEKMIKENIFRYGTIECKYKQSCQMIGGRKICPANNIITIEIKEIEI